MSSLGEITRRSFLIGSMGIAGGVAFGYWKYQKPLPNPLILDLKAGDAALTPYVLINQDGVSIIAPRAEMGQGIHTTLAALVAEELEISLKQVNVVHGPASNAYFNSAVLEEGVPFATTNVSRLAETARDLVKVPAKFLGLQITGGSSSIPDAYHKMRLAVAAARWVLAESAAQKFGVTQTSLSIKNGYISTTDGRSLSFAQLAIDAAKITPPREPRLKPKSEWQILGKSQKRVDMISKSTGTAEFGIDVALPNMLYASVRMNPRLGAPITSFDASKAETMPGVKRVIQIGNGIAAIASNTW